MENFFKNNGLAILVYITLLAVAYGDVTAKLAKVVKVQESSQSVIAEFIELKSTVKYMDEEVMRARSVLIKLDDLLNQLDKTLVRQEGALTSQGQSINALQEDMEIIKQAVVK
jgi:uncharacterized protein HemX